MLSTPPLRGELQYDDMSIGLTLHPLSLGSSAPRSAKAIDLMRGSASHVNESGERYRDDQRRFAPARKSYSWSFPKFISVVAAHDEGAPPRTPGMAPRACHSGMSGRRFPYTCRNPNRESCLSLPMSLQNQLKIRISFGISFSTCPGRNDAGILY